jgi:hypothetical protein
MSEKTTPAQDPIRVSLRFGVRSDNTLVQALRAIPPYRRPKFIRGLIKEAWRLRRQLPADSKVDKTVAADN